MPQAQPLQPRDPRTLGAYELTGRLGSGGQGTVYLGTGPSGEQVAVKLLHVQFDDDGSARARFIREAEVARQVARFCTAQILDADVAGANPYLVSEFVPGPPLSRQVAREGPMSGGALERLAVSTASALTAVHRAGIVHRDLKPHNVLLGPDGPRVIDFGLSRMLDAASAVSSNAVGTPAYMSPEQLTGGEIGPAADVFAWGSTMVFAATGTPPFGSDSIPAVIYRILHHEPELGALDAELRELVTAALSKDPALRPTAAQLLLRLVGHDEAFEATGATATRADGVPRPSQTTQPGQASTTHPRDPGPVGPAPARGHRAPPRKASGRRRVAAVAAAAALAAVAGGGTYAVMARDSGGRDPDVAAAGPSGVPESSAAPPSARGSARPKASGATRSRQPGPGPSTTREPTDGATRPTNRPTSPRPTSSTPDVPVDHGAPDPYGYCRKDDRKASYRGSGQWYCTPASGPGVDTLISMDEVCQWRYGPSQAVLKGDAGTPSDWHCMAEA
ncbi:protein kinase domain-containing protein [Spirillospora sp. CA-294931]|uniref:serine/threonine-protein kinase n=1 Tax=Spirillospora sp. CA-294931 TaxID=3240042 RepID=UPI003D8CD4FD